MIQTLAKHFVQPDRNTFGYTHSMALSPNGITLASGSEDKTICLWDIKNQ